MATPRFYCPIPLPLNETIALPDNVAHHASRALRLREGDEIVLFDGKHGQYHAELLFTNGKAMAAIKHYNAQEHELKGKITLVQGLPSGDKMDWIIEKASELGVQHLIPVQAERSVLNLTGSRLEKRQDHWEKVAISAGEQCGRNRILQIEPLQTLARFVADHPQPDNKLLCHPEGGTDLVAYLKARPDIKEICLIVGPEGGWSDRELDLLKKNGARQITYGSRILRTETAGLALTAACSALMDWV
ncbi:ribosomal RNA small subunit methyltransferase E [Advenella faeciporci]|uniref:Ribosomal RNA small subunit methyltransferase E n=1 Tax=Advenella faeciporci TaxID=797535 RepID=A0A918MYV2_9BURK|nr:16S rRNA (uracil(1498)-N(3))-methyltransferase [Advenella faeciporci]GGW89680.1 ribosomal RNA small subunit methyltransferase E [Advenella faeciporci]